MFALVVLALVACDSASSLKLYKTTDSQGRVIYYPNISPSNNYDNKIAIFNEQKKNITMKKVNLDINIENIETRKMNLYREMEKIYKKKEYLDRKIEKLNRQKNNLDREIDIILKKIDSFDKKIIYFNRQKDQLDSEIEKIDSEKEEHITDGDCDRYKIHRAAVEDDEYRITINLPGYKESEIVVKSGTGRLVVQALHDVFGEPKRTFQNVRNLPNFVTENGSWSYKCSVLRIVFQVIQRTRYETKKNVYRNGRIGKGDLDKKKNISSVGTAQVPTTYVPTLYNDVKVATQVALQNDNIVANTNSKSENDEDDSTTYSSSPEDRTEATTYGSNQRDDTQTTVSVLKQDDGLGVSTPTYEPYQQDYIMTSTYIPNQETTTYSVTANDDILLTPVY